MRARLTTLAGRMLAGTALLVLGVSGCRVLPVQRTSASHVTAVSGRPSVLVLILAAMSAQERAELRSAVTATARPGEHLIMISAAGGTALASASAPEPPAMTGPALPAAPPPRDATSFQRASYRKSFGHARTVLAHDRTALQIRQRRELQAWAGRTTTAGLSATGRPSVRPGDLASAITDAVADIAVLQQTGINFGTRKVIAIAGAAGRGSPPRLHASLEGITVAVADASAGGADAAWQAALLGSGARRALVLTPVTDSRLGIVIGTGLAGRSAIAFRLTQISYRPAQYTLPPSAMPSLRALQRLLTVGYPGATAVINGYTDSITVRGGNLALSWKRAMAVLRWLTSHGISGGRLQAIGHGAADPVAPNRPGGQPLNRRVVVIISPAS
jgi:outer membrane protein OmpA-like peptidoglycan-associated protein